MRISPYPILLVGKSLGSNLALSDFLQRLGGCLTRSETLADAALLLRLLQFKTVLSQMQLDDGSSSSPLRDLVAPSATLVLSVRVESGYVWVPALWKGRECWGTCMLRPAEFRARLRELLTRSRIEDSRARRVGVAVGRAPMLSPSASALRPGISSL